MLKQNAMIEGGGLQLFQHSGADRVPFPRRLVIGAILIVALLAFEVFNFDTTRYALDNLLGPVSFAGLGWATVLAVAFCAIDFAGLVHLFTPDEDGEQPREVWYLMGAWLLGATMNALMTWWAVSLTLLNHEFGNEVLTRGQLLDIVPIFVAVLVWLTRILFIGALSMTGSHILAARSARTDEEAGAHSLSLPTGRPLRERDVRGVSGYRGNRSANGSYGTGETFPGVGDQLPEFLAARQRTHDGKRPSSESSEERQNATRSEERPASRPAMEDAANGRVRRRPPLPGQRNGSQNATRRK